MHGKREMVDEQRNSLQDLMKLNFKMLHNIELDHNASVLIREALVLECPDVLDNWNVWVK